MNTSFQMLQSMLARQARLHPGIWEAIDRMRAVVAEQKNVDFDSRVFLPDEVYRILLKKASIGSEVSTCAALSASRPSQDIVEIDDDVVDALAETSVSTMPLEVLSRMPSWCIFIKLLRYEKWMLEEDHYVSGVFAYYGKPIAGGHFELRFLPIGEVADRDYQCFPIDLTCASLHESVNETVFQRLGREDGEAFLAEEGTKAEQADIEDYLSSMVSILLYAITQWEADRPSGGAATSHGYPSAKRTKKGWRLFPLSRPSVWHLGKEIGEQIRDGKRLVREHAVQGGTK